MQNPDRVCGFCERHGIVQQPLFVLIALLEERGLDVEYLRYAAHECPMCMLAAVMACNKKAGCHRADEEFWDLDYRTEMKRFDEKHQEVEGFVL